MKMHNQAGFQLRSGRFECVISDDIAQPKGV